MKQPDVLNIKIKNLLTRGVSEVIIEKHLQERLVSGKKLRIKFGIDPTGDCIHLGHAVALLKLKEFQDLGHTVILLIGDHTAEIGDPSGRSKERVPLTQEQITKNMASYQKQAGLILDMKNVEVRYNSEWYNTMGIKEFVHLASYVTVPQILQRADFKKRLLKGEDVSTREALYPLLQGYDSVMLECDIEVGGIDQKFNLLMGRQVQKRYKQEEQDLLMLPLLEGLDGKDKMSKSLGNFIALTEKADEMYSKIMSIPDALLWRYFELATRIDQKEIDVLKKQVNTGSNPRDAKMTLAREIVTLYHSSEKSRRAEEYFISLFQKKEMPTTIPTYKVQKSHWDIIDLLVEIQIASSKTDARRLIEQRGISLNEIIVSDIHYSIIIPEKGIIIKRGKRIFVRVLLQK